MEQLLEKAAKVCEQAEVFTVSGESTDVSFEANRLKTIQSRESKRVTLRIVKDGRIGFSSTNRLDSTDDLLSTALEMAPFGALARFTLPSMKTYPKVAVYDSKVEATPIEKMVDLGKAMISAVIDFSPETVCEAGVSKGVVSMDIMNSNGGKARYVKSVFSIGLEGVLTRGTDMLFVGEYESSCLPVTHPRTIVDATIEQLERAKTTASPVQGKLPVIFTPHGVRNALLMPLIVALNGKTVLQGASPLGHRKGEQVFDRSLSLYDDATVAYRPGSRICDDEGVPSECTTLIENGTVHGFLYDLQTAGLAGTKSTGNGERASGGLPSPSSSTLIIAEGSVTLQQMIADMKEGLIVEQLLGAGQSNLLGGDFSGNVLLGYKVENGTIVGRVKNTMVSGNIYAILKEEVGIGNEARWVGGALKTPHIYCRNVSVTTQ